MIIPYTALKPDTLRGVVEEFVSREGTDYGTDDHTFESKVEDVMRQLQTGQASVVFDSETETCDIVIKGSPRYRQVMLEQGGESE